MQFYKIDASLRYTASEKGAGGASELERGAESLSLDRRERDEEIKNRTAIFNDKQGRKTLFFTARISEKSICAGIIASERIDAEAKAREYLDALGAEYYDERIEEGTLSMIRVLLRMADSADYVDNGDDVYEEFGLEHLIGNIRRSFEFGENIIEPESKREIYKKARCLLMKDSFVEELDRIYAGKAAPKAEGHPVHYMIFTDDTETRKEVWQLLLKALYANKRIYNRRYSYFDITLGKHLMAEIEQLYAVAAGGAVIIRFRANQEYEGEYASATRLIVEDVCEIMRKYSNSVLTIFALPREATSLKDMIFENLGQISIVETKEEYVGNARAREYLRILAKERGVKCDKRLYSRLEAGKTYIAKELAEIFNDWYNVKLKTDVFPQYSDIACAKSEVIKSGPKGSAYSKLNDLIGLESAKEVIQGALDYYKAQKLFRDKGMKTDHPAMHMVFTGSPGTAKTTVARLFAQILRENEILSKGHLVEVGRSDLVGKYVGWTAVTIKKRFEEAEGGVLFIDEAYSLVDDRSGSFGDEAINTIVQEMENRRDSVVVIFAGYTNEMEKFLNKNPGLRSRIAFHVSFDDYTADELCDIAGLIAKEKGLSLDSSAREKLAAVFESARCEDDFGNGRYARNVIEKARMAQASRLLKMDYDKVTSEDITTITADDIALPKIKKPERTIGFTC